MSELKAKMHVITNVCICTCTYLVVSLNVHAINMNQHVPNPNDQLPTHHTCTAYMYAHDH